MGCELERSGGDRRMTPKVVQHRSHVVVCCTVFLFDTLDKWLIECNGHSDCDNHSGSHNDRGVHSIDLSILRSPEKKRERYMERKAGRERVEKGEKERVLCYLSSSFFLTRLPSSILSITLTSPNGPRTGVLSSCSYASVIKVSTSA